MRLKSRKEKLDRGKTLIPRPLLNGMTRDEYTEIWEDECLLGFLYCLWKTNMPLTYQEIGLEIGWGKRTVKSQNEMLSKTIIGRSLRITPVKVYRRNSKEAWFIKNKDYINTSFDEVVRIIRQVHYKTNPNKPNKCEQALLTLANKIHPGEWKFTGARFGKNRIGRFYPDLTNHLRRWVLEHYGSWCHQPEDEWKKEKNYADNGYRTISIWDYDVINRNKYKTLIEKVGEDALQNIQRMAV